jgi:uncharacterized membrane protein
MAVQDAARYLFAAAMIGIGLQGVAWTDFAAIWQPVPADLPARPIFLFLTVIVSLGGGAGLLFPRFALSAARLLFLSLALWLLAFRLPGILHHPLVVGPWENCAETAVIVAGAGVIAGFRLARPLYGGAMIVFGLAHFVYLKETTVLVPGWLPGPANAWAWGTGAAYIASGLPILSGILAPLAAWLSAVQMGGFTLLVWLPIVAAKGNKTDFQWNETGLSIVLTIAGLAVAASYAGMPRRMMILQSALRGRTP